MKILPVLDLMQGSVVRGVGGRRDEYRAVESRLCGDARPATVGQAFFSLSFRTVYVADLDAIAGGDPAWSIYRELLGLGLNLWIDAGLTNVAQARRLAEFSTGITGLVAGLESLAGPEDLAELLAEVGRERLVFSLDLKAGQPLTSAPAWQEQSAESIAATAIELGVARMIVLDLSRVGEGQGVGTEELCRWLRDQSPELELTAGGGVRSRADLESLEQAGCDAALVASALHDGRIVAPF